MDPEQAKKLLGSVFTGRAAVGGLTPDFAARVINDYYAGTVDPTPITPEIYQALFVISRCQPNGHGLSPKERGRQRGQKIRKKRTGSRRG